jgi:hypothetical protein
MIHTSQKQGINIVPSMGEPGEQCTVVFVLIVMKLACESVYRYVWRGKCYPPPPLISLFLIIYAKTTVHCSPGSSMVPSLQSIEGTVRPD